MTSDRSARRNRYILRTVAAVAACTFALHAFRSAPVPTHGFAAYYTFSRELLDGHDLARSYDYDYFNAAIREDGIREIKDFPNNLPTNALMMLPFAWLPPAAAKAAWTFISLLLFLGGIKLLLSAYNIQLSANAGTGLVALAFLWRPAYESVALGQAYLLLFFLMCLSILAITNRRVLLTSLPLASTALLKGYGLVPLLWLFLSRRWKEGAVVLGAAALVILGTMPWLGIGAWTAFNQKVLHTLGWLPSDAHVAFQTVNGFVNHLFTRDEFWSRSPLLALPKQDAMIASYILNVLVVIWVLWIAERNGGRHPALDWSALIGAGVVTAPLAEEYHFVLFLPLAIGLLAQAAERIERQRTVHVPDLILVLSVVIMALPLPYKNLNFSAPPLAFLAYPKLFAGLMMLLCYSLYRNNAIAGDHPS